MKCTNKVLLLASLFALASCGGDSNLETSAVSETTQGVSDSEIILGSHTDLSGPGAIWGVGSINGARMRFE